MFRASNPADDHQIKNFIKSPIKTWFAEHKDKVTESEQILILENNVKGDVKLEGIHRDFQKFLGSELRTNLIGKHLYNRQYMTELDFNALLPISLEDIKYVLKQKKYSGMSETDVAPLNLLLCDKLGYSQLLSCQTAVPTAHLRLSGPSSVEAESISNEFLEGQCVVSSYAPTRDPSKRFGVNMEPSFRDKLSKILGLESGVDYITLPRIRSSRDPYRIYFVKTDRVLNLVKTAHEQFDKLRAKAETESKSVPSDAVTVADSKSVSSSSVIVSDSKSQPSVAGTFKVSVQTLEEVSPEQAIIAELLERDGVNPETILKILKNFPAYKAAFAGNIPRIGNT